jgi:hypothetical protein
MKISQPKLVHSGKRPSGTFLGISTLCLIWSDPSSCRKQKKDESEDDDDDDDDDDDGGRKKKKAKSTGTASEQPFPPSKSPSLSQQAALHPGDSRLRSNAAHVQRSPSPAPPRPAA